MNFELKGRERKAKGERVKVKGERLKGKDRGRILNIKYSAGNIEVFND